MTLVCEERDCDGATGLVSVSEMDDRDEVREFYECEYGHKFGVTIPL